MVRRGRLLPLLSGQSASHQLCKRVSSSPLPISQGGSYVIPFLDEYGVSLSVLFMVTCEMVAVCWFYGIDRFSNDIKCSLSSSWYLF